MRRTLACLTLAAALSPSVVLAQAQPDDENIISVWPAPDVWSFAVGAGTDNRSKGTSKTGGDPFAYALAEWAPSDLWYLSGEVQNVDNQGAEIELGFVAGVRPQVAGFDLDLNVAY